MDVINAEEVSNIRNKIGYLGARKYDTSTSESNVIQQLEYVSWKYKNPYSVSIGNHMNYGKSTHTLGKYV